MVKQVAGRERTALEVRLEARQEANRTARQTKVSAEDIEQMLTRRRIDKRARQPAMPVGRRARNVSVGLGVALLVGAGAVVLSTTNHTSAFEAEQQTNDAAIARAHGDLAEIPAANKAAADQYGARLQRQLTAAEGKGRDVAALQQEFQSILAKGNDERSDNGAATPALAAAAEHRKLLAPYFVDRALIVRDGAAYAPGSTLPFSDDQIDPRFAWHVVYEADGERVADPEASTWAVVSAVATQTPGVLEVTWADRRSSDGGLLAWASASYYADQGQFGSLRVGQTTLGGAASASRTMDGK